VASQNPRKRQRKKAAKYQAFLFFAEENETAPIGTFSTLPRAKAAIDKWVAQSSGWTPWGGVYKGDELVYEKKWSQDPKTNPLTQREVKKQISDLGLKATFSREWGSWRVTTPDDNEDVAYYTPDAEDAIGSARLMAEAIRKSNPIDWDVPYEAGARVVGAIKEKVAARKKRRLLKRRGTTILQAADKTEKEIRALGMEVSRKMHDRSTTLSASAFRSRYGAGGGRPSWMYLWRVSRPGDDESSAYYTPHDSDALNAAYHMAAGETAVRRSLKQALKSKPKTAASGPSSDELLSRAQEWADKGQRQGRRALISLRSALEQGRRAMVAAGREENWKNWERARDFVAYLRGMVPNPTLTRAEMSEFWSRASDERLAEAMGFADVYEWQEWKAKEDAPARSVVQRVMDRKKKARAARKKNPRATTTTASARAILSRAMRGT